MYVTELRIEGMRHVTEDLVELPRFVRLPAGPAGVAIADALTLFAVGLSGSPRAGLAALSWGRTLEWIGEGSVEVHGLAPRSVDAAVDPEAPAVRVEAFLALDPPLFGRMRAAAVRDPRVAVGLGEDPVLALKVGWLFNGTRTVMTPSLLGVRLGDRPFEPVGAERPAWLPELVRDVASRFARTDPHVEPTTKALHEAWLHPSDPAGRRALGALAHPPWELPEPRFARLGDGLEIVFGDEPLRLRQLGRYAADGLRLATAAHVVRPDVLVAVDTTSADEAFLAGLPEADDAPIEQVFVVPSGPAAAR